MLRTDDGVDGESRTGDVLTVGNSVVCVPALCHGDDNGEGLSEVLEREEPFSKNGGVSRSSICKLVWLSIDISDIEDSKSVSGCRLLRGIGPSVCTLDVSEDAVPVMSLG